MGVSAVLLGAEDLRVEPGNTTTAVLSVANTGTIVEQFTIMLLGDGAHWMESNPPVVSLFPGSQQNVTLVFSPPREYTTPSGPVPFGVKVIPSNEPEESVTEEGVVTVGSFTDVGAELVPRVATGRLAGHQKLAVDSRGNVPLPVAVSAIDAADALKFQIRPAKLTAAPGEARYVRVRIRPRQRFWKGANQHKPYKVQVTPEDEAPLVLDGALTQKAVLPKWFLPLVGILAVLALLWFLVLRPIVHNDAVNASKAALAVQAAQTRALANQVAAASKTAQNANAAAAEAAALAGRKPATTTTTSTTTTTIVKAIVKPGRATTTTSTTKPGATTTATTVAPATPSTLAPPAPNDNQLLVRAASGTTNQLSTSAVATGKQLQISDIVLENASQGQGLAQVERLPAASGQPSVLLVEDLNTLTDQEYQFAQPIVLTAGQSLQLTVGCSAQQEVATSCEVALYYTGILSSV